MKYQFVKTAQGLTCIQKTILGAAMVDKKQQTTYRKTSAYFKALGYPEPTQDRFIYAMENLIFLGCFIIA